VSRSIGSRFLPRAVIARLGGVRLWSSVLLWTNVTRGVRGPPLTGSERLDELQRHGESAARTRTLGALIGKRTVAKVLSIALVVGKLGRAVCGGRAIDGEILHADRGSTYTPMGFARVCESAGFRLIGSVGRCFDNAAGEALFSTLSNTKSCPRTISRRKLGRARGGGPVPGLSITAVARTASPH
jgi:transposase InsO family protein